MSVERESSGDFAVKFQTDECEVNIYAGLEELLRLREVRSANWESRQSIQAGRSASAGVFWASDGRVATLMIGHDDETWDVALTIPLDVIDAIVSEAVSSA